MTRKGKGSVAARNYQQYKTCPGGRTNLEFRSFYGKLVVVSNLVAWLDSLSSINDNLLGAFDRNDLGYAVRRARVIDQSTTQKS